MFLYIDSTEKLVIGLIDKDYKWLEYREKENVKISQEIHKSIYDLLKEYKLELKDLDGLVYPAGPGSYTGMRVSDGIGQIFKWQDISVFNFYHFEVPALCGIESGKWISKAVKGEYFCYEWSSGSEEKRLLDADALDNLEGSLFTKSNEFKFDSKSTDKLLQNHPFEVFSSIIEGKETREIYYYRTLEEEFSRA